MKKNTLGLLGFLLLLTPSLASAAFNTNLQYGSTGPNVIALQQFLTSENVYSGPISGNFYTLTQAAVEKFQSEEKITPPSGFFGPLTRAVANKILLATPTSATTGNTTSVGAPPPSTAVSSSGALSISLGLVNIGKNSATFTWTTNVPSYSKLTLTSSSTAITQNLSSDFGYSVHGFANVQNLDPNTQYSYTIDAVGAGQDQKLSGIITTGALPNVPTCTLSASADSAPAGSKVTVSWTSQNADSGTIADDQVFGGDLILSPIAGGSTQVELSNSPGINNNLTATFSSPGVSNSCSISVLTTGSTIASSVPVQSSSSSGGGGGGGGAPVTPVAPTAPVVVPAVTVADTIAPLVPTGIISSNITQTSATILWAASTDNTAVAGYKIFKGASQIGTVTSGTSYTDTGLTAANTYSYTISAYDAAGNNSGQSTALSITTAPIPVPVAIPIISNISSGGVTTSATTITWTTDKTSDSQVSYGLSTAYGNTSSLNSTLTTSHSVSLTSLIPNTVYHYKVFSTGTGGLAVSTDQTFTTLMAPDITAPTTPINLSSSNVTLTSATISWSASTDNVSVVGYKIFRNGTQTGTVTSGTSYNDTGLTNGTTYSYTVAAYDPAGNVSAQSNAFFVTTSTPIVVIANTLSVPTALQVITMPLASSKTNSVTWNASVGTTKPVKDYLLYRSTNAGGPYTLLTTTTSLSYLDSNIGANTYYYEVQSEDNFGNSSPLSIPKTSTGLMLENFDTVRNPNTWNFYNGPEFPGATGSYSITSGFTGNGGSITFNMTGLSHYVEVYSNFATPITATAVSFETQTPPGVNLAFRITDSTNQVLTYDTYRPFESVQSANSWYKQTIDFRDPNVFSTGADDGVVHQPIKKIEIFVEPQEESINNVLTHIVSTGAVGFDDVTLYNTPDTEEIDPATPVATSYTPTNSNLSSTLALSAHQPSFNTTGYNAMTQEGIKTVRTDLEWQTVESKLGVYNFSSFDPLVNQLNTMGIKVLLILDYTNPLYPTIPVNDVAFSNFANAAAAHFKGKNVAYEIWNEPNGNTFNPLTAAADYTALTKVAIPKILAADPSAQISIGAIENNNADSFLQNILSIGAGSGAISIGWHPYTTNAPTNAPEATTNSYVLMKSIISQSADPNLQLWNTEWGYSSSWFGLGNAILARDSQAKYTARQFFTSYLLGFPFNTYYDPVDDIVGSSYDPTNKEDNFGLYTNGYSSIKPAGTAMDVLYQNINGYSAIGLLPTNLGSVHALKLSGASDNEVIAWTNNVSDSQTVEFDLRQDPTSVTDYLGNSVTPTAVGSGVNMYWTLQIGNSPVYIHFHK